MMPIRIKALFVFVLYSSIFYSQQAHIDPFLSDIGDNRNVNIVLHFKEQANLTGAKAVRGKNGKAKYCFTKLLETADTAQKDVATFLHEAQIPFRSFYIINAIALSADKSLIERLSKFDQIESIVYDAPYKMLPFETSRNSGERAIEWGVSKINAPQVWAMGISGQGVVVGGQDTGYEWNHPALINQYRGWNGVNSDHNYNWHDAIMQNAPQNSGTNPCGYNLSVPCDDHSHGTHTAGTMVGDDGNGNQIGVAPGAKWIGCRNMERGYGTLTTYMDCFEWFLAPYAYGQNPAQGNPEMAPHVINNSWYCPSEEGCNSSNWHIMEAVVDNLKSSGVVVVVSAGNSGTDGCYSISEPPAMFENSFSVGATNSGDGIAGFSSRGPVSIDGSNRLKPNISAPGVSVRSCIKNGQYASFNGTSMAGPHVAGAVALIIAANPDLAGEVEWIEEILESTAFQPPNSETCGGLPPDAWPNNTFGHGRIDVLAAVNMAKNLHITQRVSVAAAHLVITGTNQGIILKSPDNHTYKLTISDIGELNLQEVTISPQEKIILSESSLDFINNTTSLIIQSTNGSYWKLSVDNSGNPQILSQTNIPAQHLLIQNKDLDINDSGYGLLMKSEGGKCFLWRISNTGILSSHPVICLE